MKIFNLQNLLILTIFCTPLYLIKVSIFGLPSNVFEILALLGIAFIFIKEKQIIFKKIFNLPHSLLLSSALILIGVLFSILFNNNQLVGFGIFKGWFLIPMFFSFALYVITKSSTDIENIFKAIYFSSVFVGLIAIIYRLLGIMTYDNRLTAFYSSPNYLAMYLAPGVFFGLYFLFKEYLQHKASKQAVFYLLTLLSVLIPLYSTYSYGAWIAILFSLFITVLILKPPKKQFIAIMIFLFLFLLMLLISQVDTQKFSDALNVPGRSSFASRMMIWKASALLIKQNPTIGIGAGNFQNSYLTVQSYFPFYLEWAVPHPHNLFLAFWLQAGVVGLFGFVYLLFFIFETLLSIFQNKKSATLAAPLFAFFLYTILHGLLDTTYWKNDLSFLFWVCILLIILIKDDQQPPQ
jgi:O-antigen ligase